MKETRDILCLFESLNSHEVFTPPKIAKDMLDLLPGEVWKDPGLKFLDPCTKSGVFLREIYFRLFKGLKGIGKYDAHDGRTYDLNNEQERSNHILKNMVYGIATSELTGYVARRTLYGVMNANSDKQLAAMNSLEKTTGIKNWSDNEFQDFINKNTFNEYYNHNIFNDESHKGVEEEGNVFYPANEVADKIGNLGDYGLEDMYFPYIEDKIKHNKILDIKEGSMKFDVIVGNPPYQVGDGGAGASAMPVYHKFIKTAISMKPRYISMITPSRWYVGGRDLNEFRNNMLRDTRLKELHDFPIASECFPGVMIKGGVNYFLWESTYSGMCRVSTHKNGKVQSTSERFLLEKGLNTFIRDNEAISILRKVMSKDSGSFSDLVSANDPFGFDVRVKGSMKRIKPEFSRHPLPGMIPFYFNGWRKEGVGFIKKSIVRRNTEWLGKHKFFVPKAIGVGDSSKDIIKPFIPESNACCTETYLVIGPFETESEMDNVLSYVSTKFFHFLVSLKKITQEARRGVYELVPLQDFSVKWNDSNLYNKYGLTDDEILFIEKNIRPIGEGFK